MWHFCPTIFHTIFCYSVSLTVTLLYVGKHYTIRALKKIANQALYSFDLHTGGVSFLEKDPLVVIRSGTEWNKQQF